MDQKRNSETKIELYCKEWQEMNQYVNEIDRGYGSFLTIFAAIAGGTVTLLSVISDDKLPGYFFYIVPICFLVAFGYLGYQFRVTAILRGHLAHLEDEMNKIAGEKIFLWNSVLTDTHMARHNITNKFLMIPILLFIIGTMGLCFQETKKISTKPEHNLIYWLVITACAIIEIIPFFLNDTIRKETRDNEKIQTMYAKLKKKRKWQKR